LDKEFGIKSEAVENNMGETSETMAIRYGTFGKEYEVKQGTN
jgi:hypothetical protein